MNKEAIEEILSLSKQERTQIIEKHRENGVLIPMPDNVFIGKDVSIEKGAVILEGCHLLGNTEIKKDCVIGPGTVLYNTSVDEGASLNYVQSFESRIGKDCNIGPFVHIRPGSNIGDSVHLGNFVEVKNSTIGESTSVSHLTYVGDSDVGERVNFGCGTVTTNYDGHKKYRCTIGNGVFLGCNTNLIAPVSVGDGAYTAAGSTITDDVPADALGIARARQVNKDNWAARFWDDRKK